MLPAYTKYELALRVVAPGTLLTAGGGMLVAPEASRLDLGLATALLALPAGFFVDVARDLLGFALERLDEKVSLARLMFPRLRKYFREYFFYLELRHGLSSEEACRVNFAFHFELDAAQRYFLSVRQAWASFAVNVFLSVALLWLTYVVIAVKSRTFNAGLFAALAAVTVFFYYAGVYRLAAATRVYNVQLNDYLRSRGAIRDASSA